MQNDKKYCDECMWLSVQETEINENETEKYAICSKFGFLDEYIEGVNVQRCPSCIKAFTNVEQNNFIETFEMIETGDKPHNVTEINTRH